MFTLERKLATYDEFKKLEFVVARILNAKDHPGADKLLVLEVDTGEARKEIVAGIKSSYSKESLIGKDIVLVNNLEPAMIRGVQSSGMLLAASTEDGISIITTDKPAKPGSKIK